MKESAIDQLRNGTFPADWTYNILEDKAAFTGKKTPEWAFNGDCNKGLNPEEVFAKWQQVSKVKNRTTGTLRTVTKNGLGVLTGPAGGYLIAVDIDGLEAEAVFEAFMGQDYPSIDAPGTMSWRGKPTNRQLLYRMPEGHRQFFEKMIREQLDEDLKKGGNSEVCIRYGGCYSVLPGSYHPDTQGQYSWLSYNGGKVADLPDRILCWLMNHHSQQSETYVPAELMESLEQGMDKAPLSGKTSNNWPEISRFKSCNLWSTQITRARKPDRMIRTLWFGSSIRLMSGKKTASPWLGSTETLKSL